MNHDDRHVELMDFARTLRARGETLDSILSSLRERSATELESIKVLCSLEGLTLGQAKDAVHNSDAWADRRPMNQRLQQAAVQVLREVAQVEDRGGKYRATINLEAEGNTTDTGQ